MTGANRISLRVLDHVWATLAPESDWRELERRRVASGVPVSRVSWTCDHARGASVSHPEKARHIPHVWRPNFRRGRAR